MARETALITGASSGIGLALAAQLAKRGYRVALAARRTDLLEAEAAKLNRDGAAAMALTCDVCSPESVRAAVGFVEKAWGPVDVAIANAGIDVPTPAAEIQSALVERVMQVNLLGMVNLYETTVPSMIRRKQGTFVGVASLAGLRGLPGAAAYSASKAAMQAYLQSVRIELAAHNVGVVTVNPGFVETPMTRKNKFYMPFLMTSDKAAAIIAAGIRQRRAEIDFPWPTATAMRFARLLPNALYDWVMARTAYQKMDGEQVPR